MTGTEAARTLAAIRWNQPLPEPASTGTSPVGVALIAVTALVAGAVIGRWADRSHRSSADKPASSRHPELSDDGEDVVVLPEGV